MSIELPRTAGSVIESDVGVWFILLPPDGDSQKWEWRSAGGDLFLSDYDAVKRVVARAEPWTSSVYGLAPKEVGTDAYHLSKDDLAMLGHLPSDAGGRP